MAILKNTVNIGDALVTGNLEANSIIKMGGTNKQILLADGTTKDMGTSTTLYLRNDGTWIAPPNTTYSISTSGSGNAITAITLSGTTITATKGTTFSTTDTKNTAGSSNSTSKLFLIGTTAQTSSGTTSYSNSKVYATNGTINASALTITGTVSSGYITANTVSIDNAISIGKLSSSASLVLIGTASIIGTLSASLITTSGTISGGYITANTVSVANKITIGRFDANGTLSVLGTITASGTVKGASFVKTSGTSNQFLMADGTTAEKVRNTTGNIRYWDAVPHVRPDGVTQIGKYLDFHTSTDSSLDFDARIEAEVRSSESATCGIYFNGKVSAYAGFFQTSDIRKKNIIGDLSLNKVYDLIDKCLTIIYTLKDDLSNKEQIGMIAQEIQEFFPEVVTENEHGLSLDYARLTVIIFKVLKDLIKRINKLEEKIK